MDLALPHPAGIYFELICCPNIEKKRQRMKGSSWALNSSGRESRAAVYLKGNTQILNFQGHRYLLDMVIPSRGYCWLQFPMAKLCPGHTKSWRNCNLYIVPFVNKPNLLPGGDSWKTSRSKIPVSVQAHKWFLPQQSPLMLCLCNPPNKCSLHGPFLGELPGTSAETQHPHGKSQWHRNLFSRWTRLCWGVCRVKCWTCGVFSSPRFMNTLQCWIFRFDFTFFQASPMNISFSPFFFLFLFFKFNFFFLTLSHSLSGHNDRT